MVWFIGAPELFIVILVVVLFFGADKIPEIARGLGKGMRQIKDATNDIKREINESATKEVTQDLQKETENLQEDLEKITGSVKRTTRFK